MTTMVWTYAVYLTACIGITIWVARTLATHAPVMIDSGRDQRSEATTSVTRLMITGFYLVNIGVICVALKYGEKAIDAASAFEVLSTKVGIILVSLGFVHFVILAKLSTLQRDASFFARSR